MSGGARIVFANVAADDNRGGCAITFATLGEIARALPGASVALIPSAGIADVTHGLRHTRARFPGSAVLAPIVPAEIGRAGLLGMAVRGMFSVRAFAQRPRNGTLGQVVAADLVVTRGDALYVDRPSLKGLLSICAASLPALLATRWGVPAVLSGTEVGPFAHRRSRIVAGAILRRAGLIVARNEESRSEALALGVRPERVVTLPDTAFGSTRPDPGESAAVAARLRLPLGRFAVVTVGADTHLPGMPAFEERLRAMLRALLEDGTVDCVAVIVQVDGRHISDREASARFVSRAGDPRVQLIDADLAPPELTALVGAALFSVGTRMHASILSLVAGTPTFPVAVWPKMRKLFEPLGLADMLVPFPDLDPAVVAASIARALRDPAAARERVRQIADAQRARLGEFEVLLARAARVT